MQTCCGAFRARFAMPTSRLLWLLCFQTVHFHLLVLTSWEPLHARVFPAPIEIASELFWEHSLVHASGPSRVSQTDAVEHFCSPRTPRENVVVEHCVVPVLVLLLELTLEPKIMPMGQEMEASQAIALLTALAQGGAHRRGAASGDSSKQDKVKAFMSLLRVISRYLRALPIGTLPPSDLSLILTSFATMRVPQLPKP